MYEKLFRNNGGTKMKKWMLALISVVMLVMVGCAKEDKEEAVEYNYTTQEILDKIKTDMGESYYPNMPLDEEMVKNLLNIDMELVEEFVAEVPMISVNPDTVVILKAKEGKAEELLPLLEAAKSKMIEETFTYPQNAEKVQATKLVQQGNYFGLLMLGDTTNNISEDPEERLAYAEKEVQKAVDAFNSMFTK